MITENEGPGELHGGVAYPGRGMQIPTSRMTEPRGDASMALQQRAC